jgi:protein-S-isoprenylcysteine O-methyltransferase Ste14
MLMNNPANHFIARGGLWAVVQFLLSGAVMGLGLWFRGDWARLPAQVGGVVLLVSGAIFFTAGLLALGRNLTPLPQPRPGAGLVRHGIYARVRHPLYSSVILLSLGCALCCRSWPSLLAALALIPFFHAKTRREERWLNEKFPDYADYARRVPRFFPHLRPIKESRCNF